MIVIQEISKRQLQPGVIFKSGNTGDQACCIAIGCTDIIQNILGGFLFQLNVTALGYGNKAVLNFASDTAGGIAEQCCELIFKVIFLVCLADEV